MTRCRLRLLVQLICAVRFGRIDGTHGICSCAGSNPPDGYHRVELNLWMDAGQSQISTPVHHTHRLPHVPKRESALLFARNRP